MQVADLTAQKLLDIAADKGIKYRIGPFNIELKTDIQELISVLLCLYGPVHLIEDEEVYDFHLDVRRPLSLRRWWRRQANFSIEGVYPFEPYPLSHSYPLYEWGLNWCIGLSAHQYVMLHSAVLEHSGKALIMPAMPGSGKSTLCSGLMLRGWRLLSDEFGLVEPETTSLVPIPRAIPLKNESIAVIKAFDKAALMGPVFPKTRKGDIAHLAPTPTCFQHQHKKVHSALVVFPQYTSEFSCKLHSIPKNQAFTRLSSNSFNYKLTQEKGFRTITRIIQQSDCYALQYNDMDKAIKLLTELMEEKATI